VRSAQPGGSVAQSAGAVHAAAGVTPTAGATTGAAAVAAGTQAPSGAPTCLSPVLEIKPEWSSPLSAGHDQALAPTNNPQLMAHAYDEHQFGNVTYLKDPPYQWFIPEDDRAAGLHLEGQPSRLRAALHRYLNKGGNLTIAFVGGSITFGAGKMDGLPYVSWAELILRKILAPLAGPGGQERLHFVKAGIPATASSYMASCHNVFVPAHADIVFVEYARNDNAQLQGDFTGPLRRSYERLLRKLLKYQHKPAVIILSSFVWHPLLRGNSLDLLPWPRDGGYWSGNCERDLMEFALYYRLALLSLKGATYLNMAAGMPGFWVYMSREVCAFTRDQFECRPMDMENKGKLFFADTNHPEGNTGHRSLGELAAQYILNGAASVQSAPFTRVEEDKVSAPLPPPALDHNLESNLDKCLLGEVLQSVVVQPVQGWSWTDEGRKKWGYVAASVGAVLKFRFSSVMDGGSMGGPAGGTAAAAGGGGGGGQQAAGQGLTLVRLAYLKSYAHMGAASVTCLSGCSCNSTIMEGHLGGLDKSSQLHMHETHVTQSEDCVLAITVLAATQSGEHKVKVSGLVIAEDAVPPMDPGIFPTEDFTFVGHRRRHSSRRKWRLSRATSRRTH